MDILWITVQGLLLLMGSRQWLTIASADAVILSASNFGVTAAEAFTFRSRLFSR
jgi:hypothetical protein